MLHPRRYKRVIAGFKVDPTPPAFGDNRPASAHGVHNRILVPVVVHCGRRVRRREHVCRADVGAFIYDCGGARHPGCLRA
ncbi:hypothetical protein RRF57_012496 [Xylaria bambusicola]|uniref:Uncharacterized protein n=1 Tax=Xylaria bambusicola TaxID=326684 RepID=A0AAN7V5P7_9PEZI